MGATQVENALKKLQIIYRFFDYFMFFSTIPGFRQIPLSQVAPGNLSQSAATLQDFPQTLFNPSTVPLAQAESGRLSHSSLD